MGPAAVLGLGLIIIGALMLLISLEMLTGGGVNFFSVIFTVISGVVLLAGLVIGAIKGLQWVIHN